MGDQRRWRIAVVNDDPAFLALLDDALEATGECEVFPFREEDTSVGELRAIRPDLVIVDITLDTMPSAWQLALLAGADGALGPIPIIVSNPDVPGLAHRVDDLRRIVNVRLLSKPFTLEELRATVREALEGTRGPESTPAPQG